MNDFRFLYYLTKVDGLGVIKIRKLLDKFCSAENVFNASANEIESLDGFSSKTSESILSHNANFVRLEKEYLLQVKKLEKINGNVIKIDDGNYPEYLSKIYDPPVLLFYLGEYDDACRESIRNSVGIVGTRHPSDYGKHIAEKFAHELSETGIIVISGFARGIDSTVHRAALNSSNSKVKTVGILGCGIDVIYPSENKKLYDKMITNGLFFSEYEMGAIPDSKNFPKRNRIISGLSLGVIIIESGLNGGALITARCALDQGKEVFAVPGYVTSKTSAGTNALIKNGQAKLIENLDDVLIEIENKFTSNLRRIESGDKSAKGSELKGNEKIVFDVLNSCNESVHIDDISEKTSLNISDCLVVLLNLEFRNIVKQLPGKRFLIT